MEENERMRLCSCTGGMCVVVGGRGRGVREAREGGGKFESGWRRMSVSAKWYVAALEWIVEWILNSL